MTPTEIIHRYFDVWNGRDASKLLAAFTEDGKYCNFHVHPGLAGEAIAEFVKAVWKAFPDLPIELLNGGEIEPGILATHWLLTGTNTGESPYGPPTGRSVSIKGASILQVSGDKIASDQTYFDRAVFNEQIGWHP
jgi:steroid delta-isomerase-like uncharacterized protein